MDEQVKIDNETKPDIIKGIKWTIGYVLIALSVIAWPFLLFACFWLAVGQFSAHTEIIYILWIIVMTAAFLNPITVSAGVILGIKKNKWFYLLILTTPFIIAFYIFFIRTFCL